MGGAGGDDFVQNPAIDLKNVAFYVSFHKLLAKIVVQIFTRIDKVFM